MNNITSTILLISFVGCIIGSFFAGKWYANRNRPDNVIVSNDTTIVVSTPSNTDTLRFVKHINKLQFDKARLVAFIGKLRHRNRYLERHLVDTVKVIDSVFVGIPYYQSDFNFDRPEFNLKFSVYSLCPADSARLEYSMKPMYQRPIYVEGYKAGWDAKEFNWYNKAFNVYTPIWILLGILAGSQL